MKNATTHITSLLSALRPALVLLFLLSVLTGLAYPVLIHGVGRLAFPSKIEGSILLRDGKPIGSKLIGQAFDSPRYFWGRPSATMPEPNNALASGGSNTGPTNPVLIEAVQTRIAALKEKESPSLKNRPIPVDLVSASASGLDPDISPAAAYYQIPRVAKARNMPQARVRKLVQTLIQGRQFGFLGEPRVNILELNIALDALQKNSAQ